MTASASSRLAPLSRPKALRWLTSVPSCLGWVRLTASGSALVLGLVATGQLAVAGHGAWPMVTPAEPRATPLRLAWEAGSGRLYASQPGLHQVALLGVRSAVPILPVQEPGLSRPDRQEPSASPARRPEPQELIAMPDGRILLAATFEASPSPARPFPGRYAQLFSWGPRGLSSALAGSAAPVEEANAATWPAGQMRFYAPPTLALAADGTILLGEVDRILALKDGMVRPIAGGGHRVGQRSEGRPALSASLSMDGMVAGPDGSLYIADMDPRTGRVTVRRLALQEDGAYSLQTLGLGAAGTRSRPVPPTWWPFPRSLTVDEDGAVLVLSGDGTRIDRLAPGGHGYTLTTLPAPVSIMDGHPVVLSTLVAAGDDSFFAIEEATGTVLFLGPGREDPILAEFQGLRALLEGAATQPSSQASQDAPAPAANQALDDGITAHLSRIGQLFQTERPSLLPMLDRRERDGRPLPAKARAAWVRNAFRRALVKAALPELGVPREYLSRVDVDGLLSGLPALPKAAGASSTPVSSQEPGAMEE